MCGIAGFRGFRDDALLRKMTDRLRHRGPDSDGFYITPDMSLGMRRLAVLDVQGGGQPLFNETRRVAVVFNGEIYNFRELRETLTKRGHRFATRTDTEVLVHLYEEEGEDLVKSLNGMFAFALWDEDKKRLFLARDPLGIKPLYYTEWNGRLAFASEIKALLCLPGLSREVSPAALAFYLSRGSIPAPHSIFQSIRKLPPGHCLTADSRGVNIRRHWSPPAPDESLRGGRIREEAEALLCRAVESQLVSDVPLGVFLSGGLDSGAVAALASRRASQPLKTFTVGYAPPDQDYNELDKARTVAERFGCDHREFILSPGIGDLLGPLTRAFDEPFADSSAVPTYLISRESRRHVTVALTGVGGDELFGGYPRYMGLLLASPLERIPAVVRRWVGRLGHFLPDRGGSVNWPGRVKRSLIHIHHPLGEQYARWTALLSPELLRDLWRNGGTWEPFPSENGSPSSLAQRDLLNYLPDDLLCLTDRVSMAHSLEARVPFCDLPLVEFMARVPLSAKLSGFSLKRILKDILRPLLPPSLLSQTKKGFSIPLARWIREELDEALNDCLSETRLKQRGHFRPQTVEALRREHSEGRADRSDALWSLLMLEMWHREYVDNKVVS